MAMNGHDNRNLPVRGHVNPWGCRRDAAVQSMHEVYSMGLFGAQIASLPTKYFLDFFLILGSSVHRIVRFMVPNSVFFAFVQDRQYGHSLSMSACGSARGWSLGICLYVTVRCLICGLSKGWTNNTLSLSPLSSPVFCDGQKKGFSFSNQT